MLIGVPKEIKNHEYRVGMTPTSVKEAVRNGHEVWVQANAGSGIGALRRLEQLIQDAVVTVPRALIAGASLEEVAAVLRYVSVLGQHSLKLGAHILLEELATLRHREPPQHNEDMPT